MAFTDILLNIWVWIGSAIFFFLLTGALVIIYILLYLRTHMMVEIKAFFNKTPLAMFFQDNRFFDLKPITPINGMVYDKRYGPFVVTTTYVDKRTKSIIIPFDVDMDGDRTSKLSDLVKEFQYVTNNEKSIASLRTAISSEAVENTKNIRNVTSFIKFGSLKNIFVNNTPHNVRSKIEKMVAIRVNKMKNVDPMQAVIVFGAIFGTIVIGVLLIKILGGAGVP